MSQVGVKAENYAGGSLFQSVKSTGATLSRGMFLLTVTACAFLFGCKNATTIWSTEALSPDGQWSVEAHTDQYTGPGNAALLTTVSMKHTKGPSDPIEILLFEQDSTSIRLKLKWLTTTHLEVSYSEPVAVDFQAIRCGGIDISLHDLSGNAISPGY